MLKHRIVLVGRVVFKNKLIGGKFYDLDTNESKFISRNYFKRLFNECDVINCNFDGSHLSSKWDNFNLNLLTVYNKNKQVYKLGYNEEHVARNAFIYLQNLQIYTGARIVDPDSDAGKRFAEKYYGLIRSMSNDVDRIAKNTNMDIDVIRKIKKYIFFDTHKMRDGSIERFPPDCAMAQSWQRLAGYVNAQIQKHDLTLLNHELLEMQLVDHGMIQHEAHLIASRKYNYSNECDEYYSKLGGQSNA